MARDEWDSRDEEQEFEEMPQSSRRSRRASQRKRVILLGAVLVVLVGVVGVLLATMPKKPAQDALSGVVATTAPPAVSAQPTVQPTPTIVPTPTIQPTPAPTPVKVELPYYIVVDRGAQVVTVYTVDEDGGYTLPVRQMICSTDKKNKKPANGNYKLNGKKSKWTKVSSGKYAQYTTLIGGKVYFQSVTFTGKNKNKLVKSSYEDLGKPVTGGSVRLLVEDAKWIYDNVPKGTLVTFVKGEAQPDLLEELMPPALASGKWDPTDPDSENPDAVKRDVEPAATPYLGVTPAPTTTVKVKKIK